MSIVDTDWQWLSMVSDRAHSQWNLELPEIGPGIFCMQSTCNTSEPLSPFTFSSFLALLVDLFEPAMARHKRKSIIFHLTWTLSVIRIGQSACIALASGGPIQRRHLANPLPPEWLHTCTYVTDPGDNLSSSSSKTSALILTDHQTINLKGYMWTAHLLQRPISRCVNYFCCWVG